MILLSLAIACRANDAADRLFRQAQRAERAGDTLHAYLLYAQAAALEPANMQFLERRNALQAMAEVSAQVRLDPETEPGLAAVLATETTSPGELAEVRDALPPPRLQAPPGKKSFDLRGGAESVIQQAAAAFGIQAVFEAGYQGPANFAFHTGEMDMDEALRALEAVTGSLIIPVNEKLALVVRDTPQRRADTSAVMSVAIPIPERISAQDAQEIVTAVQQTMSIRQISMDPIRRMVYFRDAVSKVIAARAIFEDLSRLRAQVEVDVEFLSVTRNSSLDLGLSLPNSSALVNFGDFLHNLTSPSVGTFTNFLVFGGGKTLFGLGITDAQAFATVSRASAETVLRSQIVTLDGQAASLHVGDHYPIITNGYYGQTAGSGTGTVYTPPPTINFEDLGLVMKITPAVHQGGEISLDIDSEFKVLGTGGANGIPSISQRKYQGKVRLEPGQWAVIAGLAQENNSVTTTGIAGLASIPVLGHLFRRDNTEKDSSRVLIVLKPRLVNLPPWEYPTHSVWVGTESKPLSMY